MGWAGPCWRKQPGLGYGCSGVPCGETVLFLHLLHLLGGWRRDRFLQRGRFPLFLRVLVHTCMGEARLSGHKLESGAGHCLIDCGGLSLP